MVRKIWILLVIITCIVHKAEAGLELIRVSEDGRRFVGAESGDRFFGVPTTSSLDGTGFVSTEVFNIRGCNTDWQHIGGVSSHECLNRDGEEVRRLVMDPEACFDYSDLGNNGGPGTPVEQF